MIKITSLNKIYKSKKRKRCHALSDINLTLPDTGLVFVLGKSGSGKSTLLNLIGGLDNVTTCKNYQGKRMTSLVLSLFTTDLLFRKIPILFLQYRNFYFGDKIKAGAYNKNVVYLPRTKKKGGFSFMDTRTLTMTSQTLAMKAKRLLERNGIYVKIVRPSPHLTPKGCSFGLQIDSRLLASAIKYLEQNGISYGEVI